MTPINACRFALKYHQMLVDKGRDGFPGQLVHALESASEPNAIVSDEELIDCPNCGAHDWDRSEEDEPGQPIRCRACGNYEFA